MADTLIAEPEELVEKRLCEILSASLSVPVEGVLTPASAGTAKGLDADTFASVIVDHTAQRLDYSGNGSIHSFSVRVTIHYAFADDKSGSAFRDECRRLRAALVSLTGDGCTSLSTDGAFACDGFFLDSTSTSFEGGDNPLNSKTYSATLNGRTITTTAA